MKYAVKAMNYLKGMYEIIVFDKKEQAEKCFELLCELWNSKNLSEIDIKLGYLEAGRDCVEYLNYYDCLLMKIDFNKKELKNINCNNEYFNIVFVNNKDFLDKAA